MTPDGSPDLPTIDGYVVVIDGATGLEISARQPARLKKGQVTETGEMSLAMTGSSGTAKLVFARADGTEVLRFDVGEMIARQSVVRGPWNFEFTKD